MACIRKNTYITRTQAIFCDPGMVCVQNQCIHVVLYSVDLTCSKSLANAYFLYALHTYTIGVLHLRILIFTKVYGARWPGGVLHSIHTLPIDYVKEPTYQATHTVQCLFNTVQVAIPISCIDTC